MTTANEHGLQVVVALADFLEQSALPGTGLAAETFWKRIAGILAAPDASIAFKAARALVFKGFVQPRGYTEPLLHHFRAEAKAAMASA